MGITFVCIVQKWEIVWSGCLILQLLLTDVFELPSLTPQSLILKGNLTSLKKSLCH